MHTTHTLHAWYNSFEVIMCDDLMVACKQNLIWHCMFGYLQGVPWLCSLQKPAGRCAQKQIARCQLPRATSAKLLASLSLCLFINSFACMGRSSASRLGQRALSCELCTFACPIQRCLGNFISCLSLPLESVFKLYVFIRFYTGIWMCCVCCCLSPASISDPGFARQILLTNAENYSKGILSEILEFVMGTGLIPADGEVTRACV